MTRPQDTIITLPQPVILGIVNLAILFGPPGFVLWLVLR